MPPSQHQSTVLRWLRRIYVKARWARSSRLVRDFFALGGSTPFRRTVELSHNSLG